MNGDFQMARKTLSAVLLLIVTLALAPTAFAQSVSGELTDAERTVVLKGATVSSDAL